MQLYALDATLPIGAEKAKKGVDYFCPECKSKVRLRGGSSRQTHFYHLSLTKKCRQHKKSLEHLQVQLKLFELIGEDAQIECPFPDINLKTAVRDGRVMQDFDSESLLPGIDIPQVVKAIPSERDCGSKDCVNVPSPTAVFRIKRIADVAWHSKKIIFEIQRSPISLEEVQNRGRDYREAGYSVIWILHDKQFNQATLSAAEVHLRTTPCYFTNINKVGQGIIYDQFEVIKGTRRLFKGPPLSISPTKILSIPSIAAPDIALPQLLLDRLAHWRHYAAGDLLHRILKEGNLSQSTKNMSDIEAHLKSGNRTTERGRLPALKLICSSYQSILDCVIKNFLCRKP